MRIKETIGDSEEGRTFIDFLPAISSRLAPSDQNTLVGSDEMLYEIMDRLTGQQSSRQIITIVGMAGIGKTALARNVYEKPCVVYHFYVRAWVTVSQNYSTKKVISEMLSGIYQREQERVLIDDDWGEQLYRSLIGKRYLIVLDDLWNIDVWDEIRAFLPDNYNGSHIMITTRLSNVARTLSSFKPFELKFLDNNQSWKLLCDKVFGKEGCPSGLEELGKDIAKKCGGLPLAIVVIGGLLAKSNMTREFWEYVVKNLNSIINSGDDENCLKILYLSYKNLPIHLKPCFLYLAAVGEDAWVHVHSHIKIWVAEGFIKPVRAKSLEEVAYEYMTDLIDRNLIYVYKRGDLGRLKGVAVHDLLRDLCLREVEEENFICVIDKQNPGIPLEKKFKRRLFFNQAHKKSTTQVLDLLRPASPTCTMTGEFGWTTSLASSIRLLRVLNNAAEDSPPEDTEIMQLINVRLMGISGRWASKSVWRFTSSISQFWSLQTIHVHEFSIKPIFIPSEIWDLPQLRHLHLNTVVLPDPPSSQDDERGSHILENLQTLAIVRNLRCTKELLTRLPNVKKLKVIYDYLSLGVYWPFYSLENLVHLHKLESLKFSSLDPIRLEYISFPHSLKELTLIHCRLPWEDMTIVGSLPNLEALEVLYNAFEGPTWCPVEEQFVRLKLLVISETDLLHWRADKAHFRILEHLLLEDLNLKEFPEEFGELETLKKIEVFSCNDSTNT